MRCQTTSSLAERKRNGGAGFCRVEQLHVKVTAPAAVFGVAVAAKIVVASGTGTGTPGGVLRGFRAGGKADVPCFGVKVLEEESGSPGSVKGWAGAGGERGGCSECCGSCGGGRGDAVVAMLKAIFFVLATLMAGPRHVNSELAVTPTTLGT